MNNADERAINMDMFSGVPRDQVRTSAVHFLHFDIDVHLFLQY